MGSSAILGFFFFTILVALISYFKSRKNKINSTAALFFANRSNGYLIVGGSLFLSNINANQFIGENESVYVNNMSVIGWGITSVLAMLIVAEFFLPIYLKTGISTIPDFLEKRYDKSTRTLVTIIFLLSYLINLLPPVLYGGAVAFTGFFDIAGFLHISYWQSIWVMVWGIGTVGCLYSVLGGFRAISVSDSLLGFCMFVIAILLPYYGLKHLGDGDVRTGLNIVLSSKRDHLNAIGGPGDALPFSTLFTGMIVVNLYYWGMEQYIVQQALAARSLKDSQKGIALACLAKLLSPLLINLPGLIGVHLYPSLKNTTAVFPLVVRDTLPAVLIGLTAAIVLGAAITTFNAGLNSSSTLFVLNLYQPYQEKRGRFISELKLIRVSRIFQFLISFLAMLFAPFIIFANQGFYTYLQKVSGIFSVPIFTIVFLGFVTKTTSPVAARAGMFFFMICYCLSQFVFPVKVHYLHVLGILFILTSCVILTVSYFYPLKTPYVMQTRNRVKLQPWENRYYYGAILILLMLMVFFVFSPYGFA
jgi:SSS family solute:Na+ symporter